MIQGTSSGVLIGLLGPVVADLDGDNKPEVAILSSGNGAGPAAVGIYIFHNESYPVPIISSESPALGTVGTSVSLSGDLMNTGNATPVIRVGNVLATVTSSTNTLTTVTVKPGSATDRFNVTLHGLTGFSKPYPISFPTDRTITTSSFGPSINFALANGLRDALTVADFDDDGKPDVAVIDNSNTAKIFQNSATAGSAITTSSLSLLGTTFTSSYNMTALDIDGDGKTDLNSGSGLLQSNSTPGSISFLAGPNGVSTSAGGFNGVASSDFNKDGKVDLAVTNGTANVQVYENQSNIGKFTNNGFLSTFSTSAVNLAKPNNYGGVVAVDLDGDGYDDIASTSSIANVFTHFRNLAQFGSITASSFATGVDVATGNQPYSLAAADFDGDGKSDIAVTYFNALSSFVSVYRNTSTSGSISFTAPVNLPCLKNGYNIAAQDLDGDGKAEIVVMHQPNPPPGSFSIFQNTSTSGNISFGSVVNFPITHNPQAIAIADINLDQKPDILIVASPYIVAGNFLMVFENKLATLVITINTQPLDAIVCAGATATFTTAASGTTNITYQWQFASHQRRTFC